MSLVNIERSIDDLVAAVGSQTSASQSLAYKAESLINNEKAWREAVKIDQVMTLEVGIGKQFTSIQAAWNHLKGKVINTTVFMKVDDGIYNERLVLNDQPFGHHIRIIGNIANPGACVLRSSSASGAGVLAINTNVIYFSGFTIESTNNEGSAIGIQVERFCQFHAERNSLIVKGFNTGIHGNQCTFNAWEVTVTDCKAGAVFYHSSADIRYSKLTGRGRAAGSGIYVVENSNVHASFTVVKDFHHGLLAGFSLLSCHSADVSNCEFGLVANNVAKLFANHITGQPATVVRGCTKGVLASFNSGANVRGSILDGNNIGIHSDTGAMILAENSDIKNSSDAAGFVANAGHLLVWGYTSSGNTSEFNLASGVMGNNGAMVNY